MGGWTDVETFTIGLGAVLDTGQIVYREDLSANDDATRGINDLAIKNPVGGLRVKRQNEHQRASGKKDDGNGEAHFDSPANNGVPAPHCIVRKTIRAGTTQSEYFRTIKSGKMNKCSRVTNYG